MLRTALSAALRRRSAIGAAKGMSAQRAGIAGSARPGPKSALHRSGLGRTRDTWNRVATPAARASRAVAGISTAARCLFASGGGGASDDPYGLRALLAGTGGGEAPGEAAPTHAPLDANRSIYPLLVESDGVTIEREHDLFIRPSDSGSGEGGVLTRVTIRDAAVAAQVPNALPVPRAGEGAAGAMVSETGSGPLCQSCKLSPTRRVLLTTADGPVWPHHPMAADMWACESALVPGPDGGAPVPNLDACAGAFVPVFFSLDEYTARENGEGSDALTGSPATFDAAEVPLRRLAFSWAGYPAARGNLAVLYHRRMEQRMAPGDEPSTSVAAKVKYDLDGNTVPIDEAIGIGVDNDPRVRLMPSGYLRLAEVRRSELEAMMESLHQLHTARMANPEQPADSAPPIELLHLLAIARAQDLLLERVRNAPRLRAAGAGAASARAGDDGGAGGGKHDDDNVDEDALFDVRSTVTPVVSAEEIASDPSVAEAISWCVRSLMDPDGNRLWNGPIDDDAHVAAETSAGGGSALPHHGAATLTEVQEARRGLAWSVVEAAVHGIGEAFLYPYVHLRPASLDDETDPDVLARESAKLKHVSLEQNSDLETALSLFDTVVAADANPVSRWRCIQLSGKTLQAMHRPRDAAQRFLLGASAAAEGAYLARSSGADAANAQAQVCQIESLIEATGELVELGLGDRAVEAAQQAVDVFRDGSTLSSLALALVAAGRANEAVLAGKDALEIGSLPMPISAPGGTPAEGDDHRIGFNRLMCEGVLELAEHAASGAFDLRAVRLRKRDGVIWMDDVEDAEGGSAAPSDNAESVGQAREGRAL